MTTKLDINPFTPGIPVPAELFAGRTQQIQQVRNYLNQTASGRLENLFLTGDRGIGKSSFASIVRRFAEDEHDITSVHLHLGSVNTIDELVRRIFEELAKAGFNQPWYSRIPEIVGKYVRVKKVGVLGIVEVEFTPTSKELEHLVRNFPAALGGLIQSIKDDRKGVLIILDDINGLAESAPFANWYKSLVDTIATQYLPFPAMLVVSGLPEKRRQLADHQPSLLRIFRPVDLERLSDEEVRDFFVNAFGMAGMSVNHDAIQLMGHYSSGLPIMMQEIGDATFWADTDGVVNKDDAILGIGNAAIDVGNKYLHPNFYDKLRSERYQAIIRKMAQSSAQDTFTRQQMLEILTEDERKVFDSFLRRLRELGVIELDPMDRGAYKYTNQIYPLYMLMEAQGFVQ